MDSLEKLSKYLEAYKVEKNLFRVSKFKSSEVEQAISDLNGNIIQLNSNSICVSKSEESYLLTYQKLFGDEYKYYSEGTHIKAVDNKEQLIQYIKENPDLHHTLSCYYSSHSDVRKIKALMIDNVENINEPKKENGFAKTLGNKTKELRSIYFNKENINKPMI